MKKRNQKPKRPPAITGGGHALLTDLLAVYQSLAGGNVAGMTLKPATALKNAQSLLLIAKRSGVQEPELKDLTPQAVSKWRRDAYRRAGLNFSDPNPTKNATLNSTWTQAKSVFSKRALEAYDKKGIYIPNNVYEFISVPDLSPSKRISFTPIDSELDDDMKAIAQATLDGKQTTITPHIATMYQMARLCGMTLNEILHFRPEWIVKTKRGTFIRVAEDGTFTTKREAKNRLIPVNPDNLKQWLQVLKQQTFIENETYQQCNEWLKQYLPDRQKKLHELRKMACSEVLEQTHDIFLASKFIGNNVQTTIKYYAGLMSDIKPL